MRREATENCFMPAGRQVMRRFAPERTTLSLGPAGPPPPPSEEWKGKWHRWQKGL